MAKHLIDLDEQAFGAARAELGTDTIKDTVNERCAGRPAGESSGSVTDQRCTWVFLPAGSGDRYRPSRRGLVRARAEAVEGDRRDGVGDLDGAGSGSGPPPLDE